MSENELTRPWAIALASGLLLCGTVVLLAQGDQQETIVRQIQVAITSASGPRERTPALSATEGFAALRKVVGRDGFSTLQSFSDDSIALQSAWQSVAATLPAGRSKTAVHPDRDKLMWFLGFLDGRTRVKAPQWWERFLSESSAYSSAEFHPGIRSTEDWLNDHHKTGLDFVCTPRDTSLKREGANVMMQIGTESVRYPALVFTEKLEALGDGQFSGHITGLITRDRCYLAIHDNTGYPHALYCLDRNTGKTNWKTRVWGNFWEDIEGSPNAWVSLVEGNGNVFVFGASSGMNVEAFRIADGKPVFRFATNY